jgi:hypothetical protein
VYFSVAIWRSAEYYKGPEVWVSFARVHCICFAAYSAFVIIFSLQRFLKQP